MNTMNEMTIREMAAINGGNIFIDTLKKAPEELKDSGPVFKEATETLGTIAKYAGKRLLVKIIKKSLSDPEQGQNHGDPPLPPGGFGRPFLILPADVDQFRGIQQVVQGISPVPKLMLLSHFRRYREKKELVDSQLNIFGNSSHIVTPEKSDHYCQPPCVMRINRQKEVFTMMLWTIQEPKTSKRRKASGWNVTGNPLDPIKAFVSQCKTQGMTYQETIAAVEEKFNYFPTETEIVVNEFWN